MKPLTELEAWFLCGSQHMYGEEQLRLVEAHAAEIAAALDAAPAIPVRVVGRPVATTPESIRGAIDEANDSPNCVGVIAWMHTFSPAKMWISGLAALKRGNVADPVANNSTYMPAGAYYESESGGASIAALSLYCAVTGAQFVAKEW